MAAIYKRHISLDPRKVVFPFGEKTFQDEKGDEFVTGTQDVNPTSSQESENAKSEGCEGAPTDNNIFSRISKFTDSLQREESSDQSTCDKGPTWDVFSSFDSDDSSPETVTPSVAYVVQATVFGCVIINVDVSVKDFCDFSADPHPTQIAAANTSDDDNASLHSNSPDREDDDEDVEDENKVDGDQPISQRVRERHKRHKTGGLFPKNLDTIYDWLDDPFSTDSSDSYDEDDRPTAVAHKPNQDPRNDEETASAHVVEIANRGFPGDVTNDDAARLEKTNLKVVLNRPTVACDRKRTLSREKCSDASVSVGGRAQRCPADKKGCERLPHGGGKENGTKQNGLIASREEPNVTESAPLKPAVAAGTGEDPLTDFRLAMEFPRHNWLVKHLMKERMLKHEDDDAPPRPIEPSVSPSLTPPTPPSDRSRKIPTPCKTPPPNNRCEPTLRPQTDTKSTDAKCATSGAPEQAHSDVRESAVTSAAGVTATSTGEGTHMIGIVKPFHYHKIPKSTTPPEPKKESFADEPLPKRRKTDEKIPEVTAEEGDKKNKEKVTLPPEDDSFNLICDVKIEKYFSLAEADHVPLDLSNKEKPPVEELVLDLSNANIQKSTKKEREISGSQNIEQRDSTPATQQAITTNTSSTVSSEKSSSDALSTDSKLGNTDLYELVRKRNLKETENSPTTNKKDAIRPNSVEPQGKASPPKIQTPEKSVTPGKSVKTLHPTKPLTKPAPDAIIDVDALDDKLPTILPRPRPPRPEIKFSPKMAIPIPKSVPQTLHGKPGLRAQRNISPGATSSLAALNHRLMAANYRTRSVDDSPALVLNRFLDEKPHSAPPNIPHSIRIPNSMTNHRGAQKPLNVPAGLGLRHSSVELRRPSDGKLPSGNHIGNFNHPGGQSFLTAQRGHSALPSEQSLLSPNAMSAPASTQKPFVVTSKPSEERFRVPVKPTPIHYKRIQPYPQQQMQYPPTQHNFPRPGPGKGFPPSPIPQQRPLMSRANVVRAPPGGVSINSTPIRSAHGHPPVPLQQSPNPGHPPFLKMSPEEAQKFAAHLKVQQKELEDKINSLKELEKKIQPVASFPHHNSHAYQQHLHQRQQKSIHQEMAQLRGMAPAPGFRSSPMQHPGAYPAPMPPMGMEKMRPTNGGCSLPTPPNLAMEEKCAVCSKRAYFVCSGCRSLWYCSKTCQFQDWTKHCNSCH